MNKGSARPAETHRVGRQIVIGNKWQFVLLGLVDTAGNVARLVSSMEIYMDKKIVGLLGAVSALASLNPAQAATSPDPSEVLKASSFADLLQPIPNAMEKLQAVDETGSPPKVRMAQFFIEHHHHHHHHHHGYYRGGPRIIVTPGYRDRGYYHHHHHHHHHHHSYYRRYRDDD